MIKSILFGISIVFGSFVSMCMAFYLLWLAGYEAHVNDNPIPLFAYVFFFIAALGAGVGSDIHKNKVAMKNARLYEETKDSKLLAKRIVKNMKERK